MRRALDEEDWNKKLVVTPLLDPKQVAEASIDLRLGDEFLLLRRTLRSGVELEGEEERDREDKDAAQPEDELARRADQLQAEIDDLYERITVPFGDGLWLHPQQFALGASFEFIRLPPTLGANVLSRSTWGRLGLLVATAIMVQPKFSGALTLELVNESDSPIKLYPGVKIGQLAVFSLPSTSPVWTEKDEESFNEKYGELEEKEPTYKWPTGPQPAQILKEFLELQKIKEVGRALARI